jgi:hypothetical protein
MSDRVSLTSTQESNLKRLLRMEAFDKDRAYRARSRDGSSFSSLEDKGLVKHDYRAEGNGAYWNASIYWLTEEGREVAESLKS